MPVKTEKTTYGSFGNCLRIRNDIAELYVTLDFGPRIIHYSLLGSPNVMFTNEQKVNIKEGKEFDEAFYPGAYWDIYGGNRIWVSPEVMPDTFYPDHDPVDYEVIPRGANFFAKPQIHNCVEISLSVILAEESSRVELTFGVRNLKDHPRVMAAWSVTAVDAGGIEVIPQTAIPKGVLPNRSISLWDYTDMTDERIYWGKKFIVLRHDRNIFRPTKIGISNWDGWGCYYNKGLCFVVRHNHEPEATYHDFGASYETFANVDYVEMESVAPLREIAPGQTAFHTETWEVLPLANAPDYKSEDELADFVAHYIYEAK